MNRNIKLKPLAPRPAVDQGCQHNMTYTSCTSIADGRSGSVNRNAFVGANLGVHASPLEAVTSMDPKDYVWGGGCYDSSLYGCPPSTFAGAQPCYYLPAAEQPVSHPQYGKRSMKTPHTTSSCTSEPAIFNIIQARSSTTALAHLLLHCRLFQHVPVTLKSAGTAV